MRLVHATAGDSSSRPSQPTTATSGSTPGSSDRYYDRVAARVSGAEAVLILGPGEAKGELKKRIERDPASGRIVGVEAADKMTISQIVAKVRQRFAELE